jgi:hypothetical protein
MNTITINDFKIKQDEYYRQAQNYRLARLGKENRNPVLNYLSAIYQWIDELISA